ncbi:MAG TPA: hypothetical protein ENK72_02120 [Epsilonproteobacteria bacterium]|nr:hypothetical protein [Campylobacterota bacterium]
MDTLYLILFMMIILGGSVGGYIYYLREKTEQLKYIRRGFCPSCKQDQIQLVDKRSHGCCGPEIVTYECEVCGYTNTFTVEKGSCGL